MMTATTCHACANCGNLYPVAADQTDAGPEEVAVDSRGLVARNEWVCGACLTDAEDRQQATR